VTSKRNPRVESKNDLPRDGDEVGPYTRKQLLRMNEAFAQAMRAAHGAGLESDPPNA
jgi:hypothetical protein